MVSVLASSAENRGFDSRSGQIKDFKIGICCLSAKHAALRRKNKNWLSVSTQESERPCSCVLSVSTLPLLMIVLLEFETVTTMWYFFIFYFFIITYLSYCQAGEWVKQSIC